MQAGHSVLFASPYCCFKRFFCCELHINKQFIRAFISKLLLTFKDESCKQKVLFFSYPVFGHNISLFFTE